MGPIRARLSGCTNIDAVTEDAVPPITMKDFGDALRSVRHCGRQRPCRHTRLLPCPSLLPRFGPRLRHMSWMHTLLGTRCMAACRRRQRRHPHQLLGRLTPSEP